MDAMFGGRIASIKISNGKTTVQIETAALTPDDLVDLYAFDNVGAIVRLESQEQSLLPEETAPRRRSAKGA